MKTFLYSIPKIIQSFGRTLDVKSVLCGKSWDIFNDERMKQLFIFNKDETILISNNGKVINAKWKFIPQNSSILITFDDDTLMFRPAFFNKDVIVLQRDGTELYLFMIDEQKKDSVALFTLEDIIEYIEKEITLASMDASEQKRLRELERQRAIKEQQILEERKKEEEQKQKKEQEQRKKQAEGKIIIDYIKEHKDDMNKQILKRKRIWTIGTISVLLLLIALFFIFRNIEVMLAIIAISVTAVLIAFQGYSMSSYIDVIEPHIKNGIHYHTNSEIRKMYEEN